MGHTKIGCRWVKEDKSYCDTTTTSKLVWNGGEVGSTKIREYAPFCPTHQRIIDDFANDEDE
jgi:hypothetical protein